MDEVVLVDQNDNEIGQLEKLLAHQKGLLHRAFSIFIFNEEHQLLIQKRAAEKYHSGGLWSNTCCSHPRPGEELSKAAHRRLNEELGISCTLSRAFAFEYRIGFINGLTEHEIDHIFIGTSNEKPLLNLSEVSDFKYMEPDEIIADFGRAPTNYTEWFKIIFQRVWDYYKN